MMNQINSFANLSSCTLAEQFLGTRHQSLWAKVVLVVLASLLLTVAAKISIPFYPVPMTLQTFVVVMLGIVFGPKLGSLMVMCYLFQGALGLPVFQGTPQHGLGLAYMMGPTGGYLFAFVLAAFVAGTLAKRGFDRGFWQMFLVAFLATFLILACGTFYLSAWIGFEQAVQLGFLPFIFAELLKSLLVALLVPSIWKYIDKRQK